MEFDFCGHTLKPQRVLHESTLRWRGETKNRTVFEKIEWFILVFTPFFTSMNFVGCVTSKFWDPF
jgi:hypothetical protein